jgi:NAD(P)-dependent dehydrogenase (short-subunit alcohol dehydrogenase family)
MADRLKGKTAIITGAGEGIGAAAAQRMAEEGAKIVIAELNSQTGEATAARLLQAGHEAVFIPCDVAQSDSVNAMIATAVDAFGLPDVLVNNAGISVFSDPLSSTDADWARCFSVDLDGMWYCCRAVLPHMLQRGQGSIINLASVHSSQIIPNCFPYPVAKHGVLGLTRALAVDFARKGIRVNAISPGYIETRNVLTYWNSFPDPEAERQRAYNLQPVGRVGQPDEIAWAIVFLASDESLFMTGANMVIDGGRSILFHD